MNDDDKHMNESQIADLLQKVGARKNPSQQLQDEIKANVKSAWLSELAIQKKQSQKKRPNHKRNALISFALAASLVIAVGLNIGPTRQVQQFAYIKQTVNQVQYLNKSGQWTILNIDTVNSATKMRTLDDSFVAIELSNGLNIRLDSNTEIDLLNLSEVKVTAGSIYIDSNSEVGNNSIRVSTPFGNAQDIGTQFEVKVTPLTWRVQVRDGAVKMVDGTDQFLIAAGERIEISQNIATSKNAIKKSKVDSHDESWSWTQSISTPFKLEGETLEHYLNWVSRETGDEIRYSSEKVKSDARSTKLHGSLLHPALIGLTPIESVPKILVATDFIANLSTHGVIFVDKKTN